MILSMRYCPKRGKILFSRISEKGLVKRRKSRSDQRRAELSLTREGQKLLTRSLHSPQDRIIDAINSMPPGDRKQLAMRLAESLRRGAY
jgi:DNA-binding MarR family transcriptional regulator